ncbi:TadE/TadG family type IV pilus assembly protein [Methylocapsa sp. S129]|uniref:TadE/TadG family type IV pilus assembly protein n=1 Tax=Methylocapsa sp. S129 TaxID=1641869 RepID=UPI00131BB13F|nr:TadE/TadG family type IV pilus assembly protein [Methylocapsa sp. S129]
MSCAARQRRPAQRGLSPFLHDGRGAAAIEFAIVSSPFILLLVALLQMCLYFMAQSALDSGVLRTAETLRNNFTTGATPTLPNAAALKAAVVASAGGLINNDSTSAVEIRELILLDSAAVPIVDGTNDYGSTTSVLVLRAQASVLIFAPGFSSLAKVQSAALVRRQGT